VAPAEEEKQLSEELGDEVKTLRKHKNQKPPQRKRPSPSRKEAQISRNNWGGKKKAHAPFPYSQAL